MYYRRKKSFLSLRNYFLRNDCLAVPNFIKFDKTPFIGCCIYHVSVSFVYRALFASFLRKNDLMGWPYYKHAFRGFSDVINNMFVFICLRARARVCVRLITEEILVIFSLKFSIVVSHCLFGWISSIFLNNNVYWWPHIVPRNLR